MSLRFRLFVSDVDPGNDVVGRSVGVVGAQRIMFVSGFVLRYLKVERKQLSGGLNSSISL